MSTAERCVLRDTSVTRDNSSEINIAIASADQRGKQPQSSRRETRSMPRHSRAHRQRSFTRVQVRERVHMQTHTHTSSTRDIRVRTNPHLPNYLIVPLAGGQKWGVLERGRQRCWCFLSDSLRVLQFNLCDEQRLTHTTWFGQEYTWPRRWPQEAHSPMDEYICEWCVAATRGAVVTEHHTLGLCVCI